MATNRWRQEIDRLIADNRSGAEEILTEAISLLIDTIGDSTPSERDEYSRWLLRLGRDLIGAKPSMANLFRLVNGMLWVADEAGTADGMRARALEHLQEYRARRASELEQVAVQASETLTAYPALMTYSRSTTVLRTLTMMAEKGSARPVYLSESRPMLEGQTLASELVWAGLRVTVGIDMALFGWLSEVRALVLGADSLSVHGIVNKLGTAALARQACERDLPVHVVCTTQKFLPSEYYAGRELGGGPADEIMPDSSDRLTVRNVYFDVTPLDFITSVITERGTLKDDALLDALKEIRVFPGLRGR